MNKFMPFANYNQMSYVDQQTLANSVDSNAGSLNAGSLLTAANTVVLDSPSTNSSLSPLSSSSRMYHILSPSESASHSHQGSLRNTLLIGQSNTNNNNQAPSNLDFDLNYTNSNIASIVAKGSPNKTPGLVPAPLGDNRQLDVVQKLNNISLNLNGKLKSPLVGEIEFFGHDDADDVLDHSKSQIGNDDDDELDGFEDDNSTDNSLKGTPDLQQRMMLNQKVNDPSLFQNSSFKNPNSFNIPSAAATNGNSAEMGRNSNFTLTNKIGLPIEPKPAPNDKSRANSVGSNGPNGPSSGRKDSFQGGDINNNKNSISPSTMAGTLVSANIADLTPQNSMKNTPRFQMKLQLMKQQAEQDSRKNGLASSHSSNYMAHDGSFTHGTLVASNVAMPASVIANGQVNPPTVGQNIMQQQQGCAIDSAAKGSFSESLVSTSAEVIPRSLLSQNYQIETKLEYPTKYHVMQLAKGSQSSLDQLNSILASQPLTTTQTSTETVAKKSASRPTSKSKTSLKSPMKPSVARSSGSASGALQINSILKSHIDGLSANNSYNSLNDSSSLAGSDIAVIHNGSILSDYILHENVESQSFDSHNSNLDLSQLSSPTNSSFSQNDFLNEVDDFDPDELESFLNKTDLGSNLDSNLTNLQLEEEISEIERTLNLPKTLPGDEYLRDVLSPQSVGSSLGKGPSSCPADIVRLKKLQGLNLTEEEIRLIIKDRQKKDNHNMIERRRRFNINDRIKELGTILPRAQNGEIKQNKGSILKASVDYIKNLQNQVNKTKELNEKFIQMSILNRKLVNRIKELEMQNSAQSSQMQSSTTSTIHSSFTQPQSLPHQSQQQQQQHMMAGNNYRGSFDQLSGGAAQMSANSRQNSTTSTTAHLSLKDLVLPNQQGQSPAQVNSMPNDAFQSRVLSNEQFLSQQQQQQNYFIQQQKQQQQQQQQHMQMLQQQQQQQQQQQNRLYMNAGHQMFGQEMSDSPLNFQKHDPLLSHSTGQFEETLMDGVN